MIFDMILNFLFLSFFLVAIASVIRSSSGTTRHIFLRKKTHENILAVSMAGVMRR